MAERGEDGRIPKIFAEAPKLKGATPWERFESLARTVFSVRKDEIDATKPVRQSRTGKRKKAR
jgi:hypothetical protein